MSPGINVTTSWCDAFNYPLTDRADGHKGDHAGIDLDLRYKAVLSIDAYGKNFDWYKTGQHPAQTHAGGPRGAMYMLFSRLFTQARRLDDNGVGGHRVSHGVLLRGGVSSFIQAIWLVPVARESTRRSPPSSMGFMTDLTRDRPALKRIQELPRESRYALVGYLRE